MSWWEIENVFQVTKNEMVLKHFLLQKYRLLKSKGLKNMELERYLKNRQYVFTKKMN